MKSIFFILFLATLCFSTQLWGQSEIKMGVLPLIGRHLNIQYEQSLFDAVTVNVDLNYRLTFLHRSSDVRHTLFLGQFRYYPDPEQNMKKWFFSTGAGVAYTTNRFVSSTDLCIPLSLGYKNKLFRSKKLFYEVEYGLLYLPNQSSKPITQLITELGILDNRNIRDALKLKIIYRISN